MFRFASSRHYRAIYIDGEQQKLCIDSRETHISGQSQQILACLIQRIGQVVRRDELMSLLWPKCAQLDTNQRLNTAVGALRALLETSGAGELQIETVRGVGYRLSANRARRDAVWTQLNLSRILAQSSFRMAAVLSLALLIILFSWREPVAPALILELAGNESEFIDDYAVHYSARALQAKVLIDQWRENPSSNTLNAAQMELNAMHVDFPGQSDIYSMLGELALFGNWNWAESEQMLHIAIELDANNYEARRILAWHYVTSGRHTEAWPQVAHILAANRMTPAIRADLGWLLLRMGEHQLAQALCYVQDNEPRGRLNLLSCRHTAFARSNRMQEARNVAVQLMQQLNADSANIIVAISGDAETGYKEFMQWRLNAFVSADSSRFIHAQLLAEAGHLERAVKELQRAFDLRDPLLVKLSSTPELAQLLSRPSIFKIWVAVQKG